MRNVGEVFRFVKQRPAELDHSHHTNWCCFQGLIPSCPSPLTFSGGKLPTFVLTRKSETAREREREETETVRERGEGGRGETVREGEGEERKTVRESEREREREKKRERWRQ